jgi:hypothetical protein
MCVCCMTVCDGIFGLIVKKMSEEEKLEAYALDDETIDKKDALIQLSKTICTSVCRPDYVSTHPYTDRVVFISQLLVMCRETGE